MQIDHPKRPMRVTAVCVAVLCVAAAVAVAAADDGKIANECDACKKSLTALQEKAVGVFAGAKWKKAKAQSASAQREVLESAFSAACDEFKGWATTGLDKDLKYMKFGGTIGGGMSLTNLSMGPHVDAQLKKACKQLLAASDAFIADELMKVKRVYDADLSSVCDAPCGVEGGADADDHIDL